MTAFEEPQGVEQVPDPTRTSSPRHHAALLLPELNVGALDSIGDLAVVVIISSTDCDVVEPFTVVRPSTQSYLFILQKLLVQRSPMGKHVVEGSVGGVLEASGGSECCITAKLTYAAIYLPTTTSLFEHAASSISLTASWHHVESAPLGPPVSSSPFLSPPPPDVAPRRASTSTSPSPALPLDLDL
ncbi:hypothetical protein JCM9279_003532 [Rhodotorula babjevae]